MLCLLKAFGRRYTLFYSLDFVFKGLGLPVLPFFENENKFFSLLVLGLLLFFPVNKTVEAIPFKGPDTPGTLSLVGSEFFY